jgi:hypothetical protein
VTYDGNLISGLGELVDSKLKGVQLPLQGRKPGAYRAVSDNGSLVLCDRHLDMRRGRGENWALTGEGFKVELCDDCEDPIERDRR